MHITPPPGGGVVRIPDVENVPAGRLSSMSGNQVVNPSDGHIFKFRYRSLRVPAAGIHRYGTDIRCPASAAAGDVPARVGDTPAPAAGGGGGGKHGGCPHAADAARGGRIGCVTGRKRWTDTRTVQSGRDIAAMCRRRGYRTTERRCIFGQDRVHNWSTFHTSNRFF